MPLTPLQTEILIQARACGFNPTVAEINNIIRRADEEYAEQCRAEGRELDTNRNSPLYFLSASRAVQIVMEGDTLFHETIEGESNGGLIEMVAASLRRVDGRHVSVVIQELAE